MATEKPNVQIALAHPARKSEALGGRLEDGGGVDLALVDQSDC